MSPYDLMLVISLIHPVAHPHQFQREQTLNKNVFEIHSNHF